MLSIRARRTRTSVLPFQLENFLILMKFSNSLTLFRIISGVLLSGCFAGYILLMPMSTNLVRFLIWSLSPASNAIRGSVTVDNVDIHYISYGSGPAVLLLHGGLSNRLSWFSQLPWLVASGRQVVLMDTRGHGDSGLGNSELSYRLLAVDAIQVLDRLKIQRADVIGWSDGGNTALLLGLDWPQRVRRLVAISANFNPAGLTPQARKEAKRQSIGLSHWVQRWWTGAGDRMVELEARIKRMWRTRPQLLPADLKRITVPTLVIVGETDVVSISHSQRLVELLPHGSLAVIAGGHSTPVTQPRRVNALIAKFLTEG